MESINKLKHYIIFILVFLAYFHVARADLSLTEIMYDLDGADIDWVEVYNGGSESVDLTKIKLLISNSTSNHEVNGYEGAQFLDQGKYGVIVPSSQIEAFISKWGNLSPIFTSAFSLPNLSDNESATISINNGDKNSPIDSVSYQKSQGASENGNSLQLLSGEWKESNPTPAHENTETNQSSNLSDSNNQTSLTISKSSVASSKKKELEPLKINTKILAENIAIAGVDFPLESLTTSNWNITYAVGRYVWNFGDGTSREDKSNKLFNHIYYYPGEYIVTLSFYENSGSFKPSANDRLVIKVISGNLTISSVGDNADPFIELENKSNYEIALSGWVIVGSAHSFIIPEGTILLPNKKLKLSSKITGFDFNDIGSIKLQNPNKETIETYPKIKTIKKTDKTTAELILPKPVNASVKSEEVKVVPNQEKKVETINLNDLGASAQGSSSKISNSLYSIFGLAILIILGLVSFILIKKKTNEPIEKSIRAEDMTIIE